MLTIKDRIVRPKGEFFIRSLNNKERIGNVVTNSGLSHYLNNKDVFDFGIYRILSSTNNVTITKETTSLTGLTYGDSRSYSAFFKHHSTVGERDYIELIYSNTLYPRYTSSDIFYVVGFGDNGTTRLFAATNLPTPLNKTGFFEVQYRIISEYYPTVKTISTGTAVINGNTVNYSIKKNMDVVVFGYGNNGLDAEGTVKPKFERSMVDFGASSSSYIYYALNPIDGKNNSNQTAPFGGTYLTTFSRTDDVFTYTVSAKFQTGTPITRLGFLGTYTFPRYFIEFESPINIPSGKYFNFSATIDIDASEE